MKIPVDIGNSSIKAAVSTPSGQFIFRSWAIPRGDAQVDEFVSQCLLRWGAPPNEEGLLMPTSYPKPIKWRIIQTGKLDWQELKAEILKWRPKDKFEFITHRQIPLKIDVDFPEKVGIDRLLAAYSAIGLFGNTPMLIIDAGTAITVDSVYDRTFCGGAILPGLNVLSQIYPQISSRLPFVPIGEYSGALKKPPIYPGRNSEDAIENGIYWGTVGAIRQYYEIFTSKIKKLQVVLTGGDAEYLMQGLAVVIPRKRIKLHDPLVLEGIDILP